MPAVIFDRLPEDHIVQMFVTINAKHTRLNPSHLVSLAARQLYSDPNFAAAHDVVRSLNEREDSALTANQAARRRPGKVAQAPLAQELKVFAVRIGRVGQRKEGPGLPRSIATLLRQLLQADLDPVLHFMGRPESTSSRPPRCGPSSASRPTSSSASTRSTPSEPTSGPFGRVIAPWGRRIGDMRFETDSAWKQRGLSIDQLAKELRLALQYPEGV